MYQEPVKSPWGKVQTCDLLCPGVFLVSTASHGGTMVSKEVAAFLSPAAKRCGFQRGGYRRPVLPVHPLPHWEQYGPVPDDRPDDAVFPVRHVREGRPSL